MALVKVRQNGSVMFQLGDNAWISDRADDAESVQVVACDGTTVCVAFGDGTVGFRPIGLVFGTRQDALRETKV